MSLITIEISEDLEEERKAVSAIKQIRGVLDVYYDWPAIPKERSRLSDTDAAWVFHVDRRIDAEVAAEVALPKMPST